MNRCLRIVGLWGSLIPGVWMGSTKTVEVETERVVQGLSTVAVPNQKSGGGQRARRTPRFPRCCDRRAVGVSFSPVGRHERGCPPFAHRAFVAWGPSPWTKRGQPARRSVPSGRSQPRRSMPKPSALSTAYPRSRSPKSQERRWVGGGQRARRTTSLSEITSLHFPGMAPWWFLSRNRRLVGGCPPFAHRSFVTSGTVAVDEAWTTPPSAVPRPRRDRSRAVSIRRHLRRVDQPDTPPADVQQPRPRCRHLAGTTGIRIPTRRRRPSSPTVEPKPRTRPVQHHRRNPLASLTVVLAHVQQHVRQRPAHFRRRPLHHVVEALLQHRAASSEHPVHAPREAGADASLGSPEGYCRRSKNRAMYCICQQHSAR